MRNRRGLGLPEVLIGLFILLCGLGVIVTLFQTGLRYSARTQRTARATLTARKHLERLRGWLAQPQGSGFNWDQQTTYAGLGSWQPDGDSPEFSVRVDLLPYTALNPCTSFEAMQPGQQRTLATTMRRAKVAVRFNNQQLCQLISLVGEPRRALFTPNPLAITPGGPVTLSQNGSVDLSVELRAADGTPIPDVCFSWSVRPGQGNGTLTAQSRDGRTARFTHRLNLVNGRQRFVNGTAAVVVRTRYYGRVLSNQVDLVLGP